MVSHIHILTQQEEEDNSKEGKEAGRTTVHKVCMVFHWLSPDSLSLAELWPGKKRKSFFFFLGSAVVLGLKKPHSRLLTSIWLTFPLINFFSLYLEKHK